MKSCDEFQRSLSAYLDGEAGGQGEAIRAHVEACGACRRALARLRRVSARVRGVEEAPTALVETIRSQVREEGPRRRAGTSIPKLSAAAAILAALLWAAVLSREGGDRKVRLSDLVGGGDLSQSEQRLLYGEPPTDDEWMAIVLIGGSPR